jgi:hypothetical protein
MSNSISRLNHFTGTPETQPTRDQREHTHES